MKTPGQIAFEAYGEAAEWRTFDGRPMPRWEELTAPTGIETRRRWEVAAQAMLAEHERRESAGLP